MMQWLRLFGTRKNKSNPSDDGKSDAERSVLTETHGVKLVLVVTGPIDATRNWSKPDCQN